MKILKLQADNFKRLVAVEITPQGNVIKLTGRNAQGKSSVLDSFYAALGGNTALPAKPIRSGQKSASVRLTLGESGPEIIVKRTITDTGTRLYVESPDGSTFKSPQRLLDEITGRLTFDPLAFIRQKPAEQVATLKSLAGLDEVIDDLDREREQVYEQRYRVNNQAKGARDHATSIPLESHSFEGEQRSAGEIVARINEAIEHNRRRQEAERSLEQARQDYTGFENQIKTLQTEIERLQALQQQARTRGQQAKDEIVAGEGERDVAELQRQLADIETHNRRAREAAEHRHWSAECEKFETESQTLTDRMKQIDTQKRQALTGAKFPLPDLAFTDDGPTYKGVPIEQASSAEQLRIGMAVAMALNPKLRVIRITDGSLLDSDSMRIIEEMASEGDFQVWLEVVDESGRIGIVIDDGAVVAVNEEGAA